MTRNDVPRDQTQPLPAEAFDSSRSKSPHLTVLGDSGDHQRKFRKRASKPKVRTGCVNCKQRHLKCDERKPTCLRCDNFGIICDGYVLPKPTKLNVAIKIERPLLPRPIRRSEKLDKKVAGERMQRMSRGWIQHSSQQLTRQLSTGLYLCDQDGLYLDLFRHYASYEMNPNHEFGFWDGTLIRETMLNEAIRHSVLSIGAYCNAIITTKEEVQFSDRLIPLTSYPNDQFNWIDIRQNKHHHAALVHHAKALGCMRIEVDRNAMDHRLTMIATLLFILFENMQGNYHSSGCLVKTGLKMLQANTVPHRSSPATEAHVMSSTNALDQSNVGRKLTKGWNKTLLSFSAVHNDSEVTEMMQMFARHSVMCLFVPFPHSKSAYHLLLSSSLTLTIQNPHILSTVSTFHEACRLWDFYLPYLGNFLQKCSWHNMHPAFDFDHVEMIDEQARHLEWLLAFAKSIDAISKASENREHREQRGIALLKGYQVVTMVFTSCCLDATEALYDSFTLDFSTAVALCRSLVNPLDKASKAQRPRLGFTNDLGVLPVLAFVASKCRSQPVRQEAADLIMLSQCREGSWDSKSIGIAISELVELENMGMDEKGCIPPEARYIWTNCFWNFESRSVGMEFSKALPEKTGSFERHTLTVPL